ncbi:MAG: hypothetical protein LC648_08180 [Novosphingobium sp.]|nr:hypothetical protein [Novosphingobium sp.]
MPKIDILSPALFAGLIGYSVSETAAGFWIGAASVWLALTGIIVIAAALARPSDQSHEGRKLALEPAE